MSRVFIVGVGMTKFLKPGKASGDYPDFAKEAITKALSDAKIKFSEVEIAIVGYVYGDSTCGQRAIYDVGMTGIPIFNVNNNCATGSSAIILAKELIEGGKYDCALAVGFEKMERGRLDTKFPERTNPLDKHVSVLAEITEIDASPLTAQLFGNAGIEHMRKYGTKPKHFAKIAHKNHKHSVSNPHSQFVKECSLDQIIDSPKVFGPLTKLQCCPTSDGSAAAILCSEYFVRSHGLERNAVEIVGMEMCTDLPSTFTDRSCIKIVGYDMTKTAADRLFCKANLNPSNVDIVELHDCFSTNELITYEALSLCAPGEAGELIDRGDNTYGGKYVVNPSGGLIGKGHPLGATGLAQCAELCWQLRGEAEARQVPNARIALQHNIGLGGAVVVALYALGFPEYHSQRLGKTTTADSSTDCLNTKRDFEVIKQRILTNENKFGKNHRDIKVNRGSDKCNHYVVTRTNTESEYNSNAKLDFRQLTKSNKRHLSVYPKATSSHQKRGKIDQIGVTTDGNFTPSNKIKYLRSKL